MSPQWSKSGSPQSGPCGGLDADSVKVTLDHEMSSSRSFHHRTTDDHHDGRTLPLGSYNGHLGRGYQPHRSRAYKRYGPLLNIPLRHHAGRKPSTIYVCLHFTRASSASRMLLYARFRHAVLHFYISHSFSRAIPVILSLTLKICNA